MRDRKIKKAMGVFMLVLALFSVLFINNEPIQAARLDLGNSTGYNYRGTSPFTGRTHNHAISVMKMDGKVVFCVEPGIPAYNGDNYASSAYIDKEKDMLSKIAYYGYTNTNRTNYDYALTQAMIWEHLGDKYISTNITDYDKRKNEVLTLINKHDTLPSWNNQNVKVQVGQTLTLTDANNVFQDMVLKENKTNISLERNGNTLKITPSKDSNNGQISFQKVDDKMLGTSIVYKRQGRQTLAEFYLEDIKEAKVNVEVIKLGGLKITKIDQDTKNPLANARIAFEYNGNKKEVTTDKNGLAQIEDIVQGTEITVTEVQAPDGYVCKGEIGKYIIEPNKTIEVTLENKAQMGTLKLTKVGNKAVSAEKETTEYGDLYKFNFDYRSLKGVTFTIKAKEDVSVGGKVHYKDDEVVATVTTDENGELLDMPNLYLGKYEVTEITAPNGYIISSTPIPFEFVYGGQEIALVRSDVKQTNEFQTLKLSLYKNEERIDSWQDNEPDISNVAASGQVFGLYTNESFTLENDVVVPKDSLLYVGTVEDGELVIDGLQYPEGAYYFKELDAGTNHQLLEKHYEFTFEATDNNDVKEIAIYNEGEPLLNELHFNKFSIKKLNELASLKVKKGYSYEYKESKGAIFTLEDSEGTIIQTVSVNSDSLATFNNVPVGTFYLKEKQPSTNDYLLLDEVYKIESTKEGMKIYNESDKLISEHINENIGNQEGSDDQPIVLLELENDLIKGRAQLIKEDSVSKKRLSNAGIRLLDANKKVVFEGRTNKNGILEYDQLPKGTYYFQEYDAPANYYLDDTPIKFEIKENNELVKIVMKNQSEKLPSTGSDQVYIIGLLLVSAMLTGFLKRYRFI